MKEQAFRRVAAVVAVAGGLAGVGFSTIPASATALTSSAVGFHFGPFALPPAGSGVRVSGDCPAYLAEDAASLDFTSGNDVVYGPTSGFSGGFNVEGTATLTLVSTGDNLSTDGTFSGHAHLWANQNLNPTGNAQQYGGFTASFDGTGIDGTTGALSFTASGGETTSASGNVSGWGHVNITCSGFPPS